MKSCIECGKQNIDEAVCCQYCGTLFNYNDSDAPAEQVTELNDALPERTLVKKQFSKNTKIAIISLLSALVVVSAIIIGIVTYECPHKETIVSPAIVKTCTTDGRTKGKVCAKCGKVLMQQEIIKASHEFEESVLIEQTCVKEGKRQKLCKICGHLETEIITPAHSFEISGMAKICKYCNLTKTDSLKGDTWYISNINEDVAFQNCLVTDVMPVGSSLFVWFYPACKHCKTVSCARNWSTTINSAKPYCYYLYCLECKGSSTVRIEVAY